MPSASPPAIERWPQGSLMCRRENQKRGEERKKKKKGRRIQSGKTEAACVASAGRNNLLTLYQISTAPNKVAPGTMYEPLAWQQTAAWKGTGWKRREVAPREVDVHARWKPEREAEDKRKRRRRKRRRERRGKRRWDEDRTVDQKQLEYQVRAWTTYGPHTK